MLLSYWLAQGYSYWVNRLASYWLPLEIVIGLIGYWLAGKIFEIKSNR
jgi:hypothetical protein